MNALSHREGVRGWRPRHPIVCMLDAVGLLVNMSLWIRYDPVPATAILPLAIAIQYAVSIFHHWMKFNRWRSMLDRCAIFLVIGATYFPYWCNLLPPDESAMRMPWVVLATLLGLIFLTKGASERFIALYWAIFASTGIVVSFGELQQWLPPHVFYTFLFGSFLYGAQLGVYLVKRPDPLPKLCGFTEIRHAILVPATTIGCVIAFEYT